MPTDRVVDTLCHVRLLLGGAFVVFAIRNLLVNVPRLSGIIENKVPMPRNVVLFGIALQFVGGLLSAIRPWRGARRRADDRVSWCWRRCCSTRCWKFLRHRPRRRIQWRR